MVAKISLCTYGVHTTDRQHFPRQQAVLVAQIHQQRGSQFNALLLQLYPWALQLIDRLQLILLVLSS